jgi:arsenite methyltransferase
LTSRVKERIKSEPLTSWIEWQMKSHEYYGIDAPTVTRNLGLVGGAVIIVGFLAARYLRIYRLTPGLCMTGTAGWMLASSLWLKSIVMRSLLNERQWRGDEAVLDVGCGRGLAAIEAAKRTPLGSVHASRTLI